MPNRSSSALLRVVPLPERREATRPRLRVIASSPLPRALLFDLDGTLIDTMQVFADVAADVMVRHHGLDQARSRAAYLTTSGVPFFRQLELLLPGDARNEAAAADFETRKITAVDGVGCSEVTLQTLSALQALGMSIAVCSNNFQAQVDAFVATCPVKFDMALGFGPGLSKGPTQFERACRTFGCRRDELLFVGDSIADAKIALASNIPFVGKLGTFDADAFFAAAPGAPTVGEIAELLWLFER